MPRPSVSRKPLHILVVDDFASMADCLAEALQCGDYSIRVAYGGAEALSEAEAFQPNVLISDVHMPGLNEFELAEAFAERLPECDVVLATVDSELPEWRRNGRVYRILHKPVPLEELFEFLAACEPRD